MFSRGFLGVVPTRLIEAIVSVSSPQEWKAVYCACSGTFRTERGLFAACKGKPPPIVSNDVSLLSTALGRAALGDPLPFTFKDELAFVEELGLEDPAARIAAILQALDFSAYVKGGRNRFKDQHAAHVRLNFGALVEALRPKIIKVIQAVRIEGYFAGDFRDHIEQAIDRGAGVIAYPPTFKGGYEKMFAFVDANTEWERPSYRIYDPEADVGLVLERLRSSGIPFFLYLDQEIEGVAPQLRYEQPGKRAIFGYAETRQSSYQAPRSHAQPFAYRRVDLAKIHDKSQLWVQPASEAHIAFLREAFLSKRIAFGSGDYSVKVMIDDMLVGAISYRKPLASGQPLFVLTDLAITREARLAKLVARLATLRMTFKAFEHKLVKRFALLSTTAFSEHPDAMKYRGSWKLKDREGEEGNYTLRYVAEPRSETFDDCFRWWWRRDGEKFVAAARVRDQAPRPQDTQAA
jgi:hypothetical protein